MYILCRFKFINLKICPPEGTWLGCWGGGQDLIPLDPRIILLQWHQICPTRRRRHTWARDFCFWKYEWELAGCAWTNHTTVDHIWLYTGMEYTWYVPQVYTPCYHLSGSQMLNFPSLDNKTWRHGVHWPAAWAGHGTVTFRVISDSESMGSSGL